MMKKIVSLFSLALLAVSAWGANNYVKVNSVDQLVAGQKYILVNEEASVALGALSGASTNYGTTVNITLANGAIDIASTDVFELTLGQGSHDEFNNPTWTFDMGGEGHFICWTSGNSLNSVNNASSNNAMWLATVTNDGVVLKNKTNNERVLQYNSGSPRFACYTSNQKPAVLYVQDAGDTPPVTVAAPTLPESQEFENSLIVTITNNEDGADLLYALNDGEFTAYNEALTITETTTVHAKAAKGDVESAVVSATYTKVEPVVYTKPYVKVNSADDLEVGKKYIIVNEERKLAMGAITGGSNHYGSSIQIPIVEDVAYIGGTDVVELTLGEGNMDVLGNSTWTFEINGSGSYILWNSGNTLDAVSGDGASGATGAQWIANKTDNGVELINKSDNTRILQYNASSPRFACYNGTQQPAVLYVEYVSQEDEGITTLAEANALENNEAFEFSGNAVVTVYKNGYLFLRDESGFGQIRNVNGGSFVNGQVLNPGWEATKAGENNWNWFVNASGLSASGETNAELAAPIVLTGAVDDSMLNAYVCIENQVPSFFPARSFLLPDGTRISKTENYWAGNADATTGNYNVYGVIVKVGDAYCINITEYANYVPPFKRGDVNKDGVVNIADVTALIDYLLNGDATIVNLNACDCNQDTAVNIADVTSLIDYLLNNEWPN